MKMIAYPAGVREMADKMGCKLGSHARFGADLAMAPRTMPDLGFNATSKTPAKSQPANTFTTPASNVYTAPPVRTMPTVVSAPSPDTMQRLATKELANKALVLPSNLNPKTAIAVADRLLAIPAAKPVVDRTFQIAAMPDVYKIDINPEAIAAIERAAATLDAAKQIRETSQTPANQPLVPIETADQSAAVTSATTTYALSDADLEALATATQQLVADSRPHGAVERFLDWLKHLLTGV